MNAETETKMLRIAASVTYDAQTIGMPAAVKRAAEFLGIPEGAVWECLKAGQSYARDTRLP